MTIRRAVAMLMIVAFAVAPVIRPVMAQAGSDAFPSVAAVAHEAMAMGGMDGDMPCCPSKSSQPVDCEKCLLMATCMTKCFTGHPDAWLNPVLRVVATLLPGRSDFWPDGFGHPPPDHPPRTSI